MVASAQSIIKPISRFQRAIHVRYDLRDTDAIEQYIPTQSAADALKTILRNTNSEAGQRAHVLHAAYGSGKSHFAVALAGLLENTKEQLNILHAFAQHLGEVDATSSELAHGYIDEGKRLFPVMLSGNEGGFAPAMLRALTRSLNDSHIDVQLSTRFDVAINTIGRWKADYPDFYQRLKQELKSFNKQPVGNMLKALQAHDNAAYDVFVDLYAKMTAGAVFDPLVEQSPELIYRDVATQLRNEGYDGIVVIWDEFGRYLEAHTSQAFGNEAAALQNFAETCNYSHDEQLHLLLFTHKELQGYAASLPQSYQQEWSRIEGRFQRHDLSTDPLIAYRLIANAIQHTEPTTAYDYLNNDLVDWFIGWSKDYRLFGSLSEQDTRQLIYNTWPLHPLTVFALAHLSNRIAQNERTMFTFLTSDEPNALRGLVERKLLNNGDFPLIRIADLWDYFETSVRADVGGSGAHRYWSGVINALDKVSETDDVAEEIIKALGVLAICADTSAIRPTTDLLGWAVGAGSEEQQQAVIHALDNLRRRKVVLNRQIDGYWTFINGSDINFEELLRVTLERINPSPTQLRRLLEQTSPAPYTLARRYNQQRSMIRFFKGVYRWADEILDAPWDLLIEQEEADGLIIYILATDDLSWQAAYDAIQSKRRVVYVMPREEHLLLSLIDVLRELFALQEINNDATLRQHDDGERIQREIDWLLEDAEGRLDIIIKHLIDPRQEKSVWITTRGKMAYGHRVNSPGQTSKIVSDICDQVFSATPLLNSEGLNRRHPTAQQSRAAQQVIDALFSHKPDKTLGMKGRGPEILALNALLKIPGILHQDIDDVWSAGRPDNNKHLAEVWDTIEDYLSTCVGDRQTLETLVTNLTTAPFGLREGVIPVFIAAVLRNRLMVTSMWHNRSPISLIDGHTLVQAIEKPDEYSIEIGHWSPVLDDLWQVLTSRFDEYIQDIERDKQPLSRLRSGMTRWLQGLPAFCRFTRQISDQAIQFRDIIRKVQTEPAKAIFESLPVILTLDEHSNAEQIASAIDRLMQEVSNAYYDLQRRLDVFVGNEFGYAGLTQDGLITLKSWLSGIQTQNGTTIDEFKFSTTLTQNVVNLLLNIDANDGQFWNQMSEAVLGVSLRDWNDNSEERFQAELSKARDEVERDVHELMEEDKTVSFAIQLPDSESRDFRFRSSELSQHGQRLLQNFKSTMEIAGRPLSVDERRKIALAFLVHVMGEDLDG
jgi:energy-coupling factor transporter ATP-binding protein EcfA2